MIPIQISQSQTLVRDKDGKFVPNQNIAVNFGTTVNINDNSDGSKDSTWSSERLGREIETVVGQIVQQALDLQQQIDVSKPWSVVIESENGRNCYNKDFRTTLNARVYHGSEDVTDQYDASMFRWRRESYDSDGDTYWNTVHNTGTKSLIITAYDMVSFSTTEFICEFWEDEIKLASSKGEF